VLVLAAVALPLIDPWGSKATAAPGLLQGFVEDSVLTGLNGPTAVRFSPDGRVFVAEKPGIVKVFDSLSDPTPDVFADLRKNVHNFWDRGLLGLALHPNFPATPYLYVAYTHDAAIGGTAPRWGTVGGLSDPCPTPPGPNADGCVVSGRISRLTAAGNTMTGPEHVLVEDFCQQYPSHSVVGLAFGADGMLYGGGGDGANYNFLDYGQDGDPVNPCGDPGGAAPTPPTAEGGALRSQDLRTLDDPVGLDGSIVRIDPLTGEGLADNPLGASADANARRVVATGLRNPFRIAIRPGTNEVWIGDVGGGLWEELDVVANPTDGSIDNFGWPCYEGAARQPGFDALDLTICEQLYAEPGAVTDPFFAYRHGQPVLPDGACSTGGGTIAGIAFAPTAGGTYPSSFAGAAFFADYSRDCIWVMRAGPDGRPSPNLMETFVAGATNPVDLQIGPEGALYYADIFGGTVRRIRYVGETTPPTVTAKTPVPGATGVAVDANVTVTFSESMNVSTLDASTLVVRAGDANGPVVPAAVTYDAASLRAVIDPTASLAPDTEFHVRVEGGASGVKDVAGNWLAVDDTWSFTTAGSSPPPSGPANDGFGSAQVVSGGSGSVSGSTVGASKESGEPAHAAGNPGGASVWFRWVAPGSGQATFATSGSSFDTLLGVYTGSSVSGLTVVGQNDDLSASVYQSSVTFAAVAGTTYQIAVDGWRTGSSVANGSVSLTWSGPAGPPDGPPDAPRPEIIDPGAPSPWVVGDTIAFRGTATDDEDGVLPASALSWSVVLQHCPSDCHEHEIQRFPGVVSGSFVAPDHEYPSHLELRLTATDSGGLSTTVSRRLDPLTVDLGFASLPLGLAVGLDAETAATPFGRTVIVGSTHTVAAPTTQDLAGNTYEFVGWSDGGARVHQLVAPGTPSTLTAVYRDVTPPSISAVSPVHGSTRVHRAFSPTATFSENMDADTITTATMTVRQGTEAGPVVAATLVYDLATRTVTIDPIGSLSSKATYTVVVQGGPTGVKDLAGNWLASTYTWAFTTR